MMMLNNFIIAMDDLESDFKLIDIKCKDGTLGIPKICFEESNMVIGYIEDYGFVNFEEYKINFIKKFIFELRSKYFNKTSANIESVEELNDMLLFCDKFQFISMYMRFFKRYNHLFTEDKIY